MELPRGYFDEAYADRGSMTINFKNPNFLVFKGVLDNSDEEWFTGFMGYYFQATRNPLVVIADRFEKSFNDLVKINKRNNERQGIPIDIALISANSTKEEETEDLAIYLDATLLDKTDEDSEFSNFKFSFLGNDVAGITKYIDFLSVKFQFPPSILKVIKHTPNPTAKPPIIAKASQRPILGIFVFFSFLSAIMFTLPTRELPPKC